MSFSEVKGGIKNTSGTKPKDLWALDRGSKILNKERKKEGKGLEKGKEKKRKRHFEKEKKK